MMGGSLKIDSQIGLGTTVLAMIPLPEADHKKKRSPSHEEKNN
jgi:hypothetical protein